MQVTNATWLKKSQVARRVQSCITCTKKLNETQVKGEVPREPVAFFVCGVGVGLNTTIKKDKKEKKCFCLN